MLRRALPLAVLSLALFACSSSASEDVRVGDIRGADVWRDGLSITGTVTIAPGAVVEIEPGAKINVSSGSQILVGGVLKAKAGGSRAVVGGTGWEGILVAQGGKVEFEGVEIQGAKTGINATEGAGDSSLVDSAILNARNPFMVGPKAKLTLTKVKATTVPTTDTEISISEVYGTLVASRLDYDAGPNEGIRLINTGDLTLEDSTIHGTNAQDLISSYGAKHVKISYSTFAGAHCGLHIEGADSFEIDHVTSEKNTYAITIYASGAGPNVVRDSNLTGDAAWLDFQGQNGPITFERVYTKGSEIIRDTVPSIKDKASAPKADAKPR